jgi:hypothetical protein
MTDDELRDLQERECRAMQDADNANGTDRELELWDAWRELYNQVQAERLKRGDK